MPIVKQFVKYGLGLVAVMFAFTLGANLINQPSSVDVLFGVVVMLATLGLIVTEVVNLLKKGADAYDKLS